MEELETNIRNTIAEITPTELAKVSGKMLKRAELCIQVHGQQFQHLLWTIECSARYVVLNNNNFP